MTIRKWSCPDCTDHDLCSHCKEYIHPQNRSYPRKISFVPEIYPSALSAYEHEDEHGNITVSFYGNNGRITSQITKTSKKRS